MANYTEEGYDISENNYWKGTTSGDHLGWPRNYFYADTIRSLCIGFGNYFNNLYVVRRNEYGEPIKQIQVPIKFGPRMKAFDFRREQESGKTYYLSYPSLTYRIDSMEFDSARASGIYEYRAFYNDTLEEMGIDYTMTDKFWSDVNPVPYNFTISMEAYCDKIDDANQIAEQIAVRFNPAGFFNIKEFWFFNKRRSIKMTMNSAPSWSIESESMGEEDKREIKLTFSFTLAAYLYKPITRATIIDKINTYITMKKSDYKWVESMYGNYDGTLTHRYDLTSADPLKTKDLYDSYGEHYDGYYTWTISSVSDQDVPDVSAKTSS